MKLEHGQSELPICDPFGLQVKDLGEFIIDPKLHIAIDGNFIDIKSMPLHLKGSVDLSSTASETINTLKRRRLLLLVFELRRLEDFLTRI